MGRLDLYPCWLLYSIHIEFKGTSQNPVFQVIELASAPVNFDKACFSRRQPDKWLIKRVRWRGYFVFWTTDTSCGVFRPRSFSRMLCAVRARL